MFLDLPAISNHIEVKIKKRMHEEFNKKGKHFEVTNWSDTQSTVSLQYSMCLPVYTLSFKDAVYNFRITVLNAFSSVVVDFIALQIG